VDVKDIELDLIDPNPYQTREKENPEHIQQIAASIGADGLLQVPLARKVGERYQLAFGHTRLAAYRLLDQVQYSLATHKTMAFEEDSLMARVMLQADRTGDAGILFSRMPLQIRELTDEEMFRFAVRENHDRADLTPIETARSMSRYRDQFQKTSAQIGELFGLNEATVRGKLRLLQLPPDMQKQLSDGHVGEMAMRELLAVFDLPEDLRKRAEENWYLSESKPSKIIQAALQGAEAQLLRQRITALVEHEGKKLSEAPWKWEREFSHPDILGVCKGCAQMVKRDKASYCLLDKCYRMKKRLYVEQYLSEASAACGLLALDLDEDHSASKRFEYGGDLPEFNLAQSIHCPNLRIEYRDQVGDRDIASLKDQGFPHAFILCSKRAMNCTCLQAVNAGVRPEQPITIEPVSAETGEPMPAAEAPARPATIDDLKEKVRDERRAKRQGLEEVKAMQEEVAKIFANALAIGNPRIWKRLLRKIDWSNSREKLLPTQEYMVLIGMELAKTIYSTEYNDPNPDYALKSFNGALKEAELGELSWKAPEEAQPQPVSTETPAAPIAENGKTLVQVFGLDSSLCPDCHSPMDREVQEDGWVWLHCTKCDKWQATEERGEAAA
jgi:ParB-like chromosome segregation protein Spo0J